jgi:hypothetical protein
MNSVVLFFSFSYLYVDCEAKAIASCQYSRTSRHVSKCMDWFAHTIFKITEQANSNYAISIVLVIKLIIAFFLPSILFHKSIVIFELLHLLMSNE